MTCLPNGNTRLRSAPGNPQVLQERKVEDYENDAVAYGETDGRSTTIFGHRVPVTLV